MLFDLLFFFFLFLAGAVCYPTCIVALDMDLRDPVVLPSGSTVDSLKHWIVPTKVQVRCLMGGRQVLLRSPRFQSVMYDILEFLDLRLCPEVKCPC